MKNKHRFLLVAGVFACLLVSCEQYAIFSAIAQEVEPKPALIKGSPSEIVKDSTNLYVANGELWSYPIAGGSWTKVLNAPAGVRDVAVISNDIYVVAVDKSPSLSKIGGGVISPPSGTVQGIYGANDTLFVAAGDGATYSVYAYNGTFTLLSTVSGLLKGAAHYSGNYYLATSEGLFSTNGATSSRIQGGNFLGVMEFSGKVIAVTEKALYEVSSGTATQKVSGDSFTGALAVSGTTLYVGRARGYREVDMNASNWELKTPSIGSYASTIALVRVTSMYAVGNNLMFASVLSSDPKRSGLMSLHGGSWNMEE
jgi:hypothetical protein